MDPVIEIDGLTKWFGPKLAVNGLTLEIPHGSIYALLGENGAGKSTTIRMLTGLLQPDAGKAWILGKNCWDHAVPLRRRVGYVPDRPKYYDWMTVGEIGWFVSGFHGREFLPAYRQHIKRFDLDLRARLGHLSKGMYAKVGLALALAVDPRVLILDEPTSGLDLLIRREFLSSMVDMAGEGRTILISSHQVAEIERIASHVAFMADGALLLSGTMEEVRDRLLRVRLGYNGVPPNPDLLGTVLERKGGSGEWELVLLDPNLKNLRALHDAPGVQVRDESPVSLEEAYCALLGAKEEVL